MVNKGVLSILISILGFYLVYKSNYMLYQLTTETLTETDIQNLSLTNLTENKVAFGRAFRIGTLCVGLLSLYLGVISYLKKNKIGKVAVITAILLIIMGFVPFWKYVLDTHNTTTENQSKMLNTNKTDIMLLEK